jgi:hypothetical protein
MIAPTPSAGPEWDSTIVVRIPILARATAQAGPAMPPPTMRAVRTELIVHLI